MIENNKTGIFPEFDEATIENFNLIKLKFKNILSDLDILNWLRNFKFEEWELALRILKETNYLSENELIEYLDNHLKKILENFKNHNFYFIGIGNVEKSGNLILYYLNKTEPFLGNNENLIILDKHLLLKKIDDKSFRSDTIFIYVDDINASGGTFKKFYRSINSDIKKIPTIEREIVLSIFRTKYGEKSISKLYPNIEYYSSIATKIFSKEYSIFGPRDYTKELRGFAYKYGKNIVNSKIKPLGYKNAQNLIVFPHNIPNTTLPIIWSNKKGWKPLIPRSPLVRMSKSKEIRKEIAHSLSQYIFLNNISEHLFEKEKKIKGWKTKYFISKGGFQMFAIIRLKKQRRIIPVICQILGISEKDYESKIEEGKTQDLFDKFGNLTDKALKIYSEYLEFVGGLKKKLKSEQELVLNERIYLPKKFIGKS